MSHKKAPELSEFDWRRVARGGALAEALAVGPHPVRDTGGEPERTLRVRGGSPAATVLTIGEWDGGVRLEDDALVVRLAGGALAPEADRGTGAAGRHDAWWDAWHAAFEAWHRSGRPHLIVDTWALVCGGADAVCLIAQSLGETCQHVSPRLARGLRTGRRSVSLLQLVTKHW